MSKTNLLRLCVLVLVVGGALFFGLRQRPPHPVAVGERAPDFTLPAVSAAPITLRDYRQQVIVLNFWATWCPPCIKEAPSLEKFAAQMRDKGVVVIGVSVDHDTAALRKFVAEFHLSFPVALDSARVVASRYGTFKFPETYIVDRDGRIAEKIIGDMDWQDPRMISFVQELARGLKPTGK